MPASMNAVIGMQTASYLAGINPASPPTPRTIENELLARTNDQLEIENLNHHRKNQIAYLQKLTNYQLAQIMLRLHHICKIAPAPDDLRQLDERGLLWGRGPGGQTKPLVRGLCS